LLIFKNSSSNSPAQNIAPTMDSLRKRYSIKLLKSSVDAMINMLLLLFVPSTLGPESYGSFNFIRDSFQNIIGLLDLNLGAAHINYAARKENSGIATSVYFTYVLIIGVLVLLFVSVITLGDLDSYVFPGQSTEYLILGALLAYLMHLFSALAGLSDSKLATYGFELRSMAVSVAMFTTLVALYLSDTLSLMTFFTQRVVLYILLLGFATAYLFRKINFRPRLVYPRQPQVRVVIREFLSFSNPLITISVIGLVFGFFDRWFLQVIYGSVSQGFFGLAFSLSSVASLFLAPMTPLLMQSVAKADEVNDIAGVRSVFDKVKFLYLIGSFLSIFFMFHTEEIIGLIGGDEYNAARLTVLVMFLYPIHIVYGQFCGGVLIALRKTHLYRNIALLSTMIGVIISYFLLAPKSYLIPGLELDSLGLALKLVLIQFLTVTLQLYFVCKHVNARFSHYLFSQIVIPIPIVLIGIFEWLIREHFRIPLLGPLEIVLNLAVSMTLWSIVVVGVLWRFPVLVGFEKSVLRSIVHQLLVAMRRKAS
jgi:O-antigen/teichoic acid export membrane protein